MSWPDGYAAVNTDVGNELAQTRMQAAGLTPCEISSLLDKRYADATALTLLNAADALTPQINALAAFVRDPLRQLELLGADLAGEVRAWTEALAPKIALTTASSTVDQAEAA